MWLFALFVAVPIIEIGLFIQVGGAIGLWPTLAIVVITAIIGTAMIRVQGANALRDLQHRFNALEDPSEPLAHGAMILFSGALLLTPGFFTDTIGFLLLLPPVRSMVFHFLRGRVQIASFSAATMRPEDGPRCGVRETAPGDDIIDGEFTEVDPEKTPTHPPSLGTSGWTRH